MGVNVLLLFPLNLKGFILGVVFSVGCGKTVGIWPFFGRIFVDFLECAKRGNEFLAHRKKGTRQSFHCQ